MSKVAREQLSPKLADLREFFALFWIARSYRLAQSVSELPASNLPFWAGEAKKLLASNSGLKRRDRAADRMAGKGGSPS